MNKLIFIDFGAYKGNTINKAFNLFDNIDEVYALEPITYLYNKVKKRFAQNDKIKCINKAVDIETGKDKIYIHKRGENQEGHSLIKNKINVSNKFKEIEKIDIIEFFDEYIDLDANIILKIDIEGKEYDILEKLIDTGYIKYINTIYCEWHYQKISDVPKSRHNKLIKKLKELGVDLTGNNKHDEFKYVKDK